MDLFSDQDEDSICLEVPDEETEVQVNYQDISSETDKAICFVCDGVNLWHPKSQIFDLDKDEKTFFVPEWLYEKKLKEYNEFRAEEFKQEFMDFLEHHNAIIKNIGGTLVIEVDEQFTVNLEY